MDESKTPKTPAPAAPEQRPDEFKQWRAQVAEMKARAASVDWSKVDFSKLAPRDIGVQFGPMLTEEQFREYRKRAGGGVQVVRAPTKKP